jgi:RND family efflux transporter MFP subunit
MKSDDPVVHHCCAGFIRLHILYHAANGRWRTRRTPGVITRRYVDLGALIQSAASSSIQAMPVVSLADASVIRVVVDIPESEVAFVGPDTAGTLALPEMPGRTFPVRFSRSGHTLKPNTRTLRVEMDLPNPDRLLKPGLFGQVTLVMEMHRGATVVPSAAVGGKGADRFVFLAVDGKAVRRSVQVGFVEGGLTEIRAGSEKGVSDGEVVMLAGTVPLQEGRPVEIRLVDY